MVCVTNFGVILVTLPLADMISPFVELFSCLAAQMSKIILSS